MKLQHIVTLNSGKQEVYHFNSKPESDKALENAFSLAKTFDTISNILIKPTNNPEKWEKITFKYGRIVEWIDYNSQAREEFNKEYNRGKISYTKVIELLKKLIYCLTEDFNPCNMDTLDILYDIGMTDDEIECLGYGYLLEESEEK